MRAVPQFDRTVLTCLSFNDVGRLEPIAADAVDRVVEQRTVDGGAHDHPRRRRARVGRAVDDLVDDEVFAVADRQLQVRGVDAVYGDNVVVNLPRFNWEERNIYAAAPTLVPYYPVVAYRVMQNPTTGLDAIELIPRYGIPGAAAASSITYGTSTLLTIWNFRRLAPVPVHALLTYDVQE